MYYLKLWIYCLTLEVLVKGKVYLTSFIFISSSFWILDLFHSLICKMQYQNYCHVFGNYVINVNNFFQAIFSKFIMFEYICSRNIEYETLNMKFLQSKYFEMCTHEICSCFKEGENDRKDFILKETKWWL